MSPKCIRPSGGDGRAERNFQNANISHPKKTSPTQSKLTVICREFKSLRRNTLIGFTEIRVAELRLDVKDIAIHAKGDSRWAALPAKPMIDRDGTVIRDSATGKIQCANVFEFADRATRDAFSHAVIAALLELVLDAFEVEEDVSS
jgi:hypothetical protein